MSPLMTWLEDYLVKNLNKKINYLDLFTHNQPDEGLIGGINKHEVGLISLKPQFYMVSIIYNLWFDST